MHTSSLIALPRDCLTVIFSYCYKEKEIKPLQILAVVCKTFHQICYQAQFPLAEKSLIKFYPRYEAVKPKEMSYSEYYNLLQTPKGVWYAFKKGYRDGQIDADSILKKLKPLGELYPKSSLKISALDLMGTICGLYGGNYSWGAFLIKTITWTSVTFKGKNVSSYAQALRQIPGMRNALYLYGICSAYFIFKAGFSSGVLTRATLKVCAIGEKIRQSFSTGVEFYSILRKKSHSSDPKAIWKPRPTSYFWCLTSNSCSL